MITYAFLQQYWWALISILGGLLVFLMFVQGGNAQIFSLGKSEDERKMIINSTGRKWEFTFTTLVTFGGAFFASFPLFYSTSFGGAYWVWILILVLFVLQAVSYEFQSKSTNPKLIRIFRSFLVINGVLAPFLVGAAVSTFFTGSDFVVNKDAMGSLTPVISSWGSEWHGLEALCNFRNWLFGFMLVFLAQTLGSLYMLNNIDDQELTAKIRGRFKTIALCFVVFFLGTAYTLLTSEGYAVDAQGVVSLEPYKYLYNFLQMPAVLVMFLVGVVLVLVAIAAGLFCNGTTCCCKGRCRATTESCDQQTGAVATENGRKCYRRAIWPAGIGTVLVVIALFMVAGYNGTAYYPSYSNLQSSLTITNSCSSEFTLSAMAIVSLLIPFVLAYIAYAWYKIDRKSITKSEISASEELY